MLVLRVLILRIFVFIGIKNVLFVRGFCIQNTDIEDIYPKITCFMGACIVLLILGMFILKVLLLGILLSKALIILKTPLLKYFMILMLSNTRKYNCNYLKY